MASVDPTLVKLFLESVDQAFVAHDAGEVLASQQSQDSQTAAVKTVSAGFQIALGALATGMVTVATMGKMPFVALAMGVAVGIAEKNQCDLAAQGDVNIFNNVVSSLTTELRNIFPASENSQQSAQYSAILDAASVGDVQTARSLANEFVAGWSPTGFGVNANGSFTETLQGVDQPWQTIVSNWSPDFRVQDANTTSNNGTVTAYVFDAYGTGKISQEEAFFASGGTTATLYSGDPNISWSSQTSIFNPQHQLLGTATSNRDGTTDLDWIDQTSGKHVTTHLDANGKIASQTADPGIGYNGFVKAIADTLATQLISKFLTANNIPATIAVRAFAEATINSALSTGPVDFSQELASSAFDIAGGIAGSDVGVLVANALGIPTQAGSLVGGVVGNEIAQAIVKEAMSGFKLTADQLLNSTTLGTSLAGAGGAALGSLLAGALFQPTEAGQIIGSLATAAAVADATEIAEIIGLAQPELAPLAIFAIAFGSDFLGNVIGDIFSSIFGNNHPSVGPNANSRNAWNPTSHTFKVVGLGSDNGASTNGVKAMGDALDTVMGNIVTAMGGTVVGKPQEINLAWFKGKYFFTITSHDAGANQFNDPNSAVEAAAINWLATLTIAGGDPYMAYVAKHSSATSLAGLYSELNAAKAFSNYMADPAVFDLALAAANDPSVYATWQQELARAQALGLDKLTAPELSALHQYGYVTSDNIVDQGTVLGHGSNFLELGSTSYFVNTTDGLKAWQFDARAGLLTGVVQLHNPNGSAFVPSSGMKILASAANLTGGAEYDLIAQDASGHLSIFKVNAQGVVAQNLALNYTLGTGQLVGTARNALGNGGFDLITADGSGHVGIHEFNSLGQSVHDVTLTYSSGSPFTYVNQPVPAYGSAEYTAMWRGNMRTLGFTGDFDGMQPLSWFEQKYGVALDNQSAAGMQQLLDRLALLNPTIVAATHSASSGGYDLVVEDRAGHVATHSFSMTGQLVSQQSLVNSDGSAFALATGATLLPAGNGFFGHGGRDFMVVDATGQASMVEFNAAGRAYGDSNLPLYVQDGGHFHLPAGSTFLLSASNFYGSGDHNLIFQNANGSLQVMGFGPADPVRAVASQTITNANGSLFILPAYASLAPASTNFLGQNGFDFVVIDGTGQVSVMEVDPTGKAANYNGATNTPLYAPDGGHMYLPTGSSLLLTTDAMFGSADHDLLFQKPDGTLQLLGFDGTNRVQGIVNETVMKATGVPFVLAAGAGIASASKNFLGHGGVDFLVLDASGQASVMELDSTGKAYSYNGESATPLYAQDGGHLYLPAGAKLLSAASTFFAQNDHDLILQNGDGSVQIMGFDATNRVLTLASQVLKNADGSLFTVGAGTTVLGTAQNLLGGSGHDLLVRDSHGVSTVNEFNTSGQLIAGGSRPLINAHDGDTLQHYNGVSDLIDLGSLAFDSSITATPVLNPAHTAGQLVVTDHGHTVATITLASVQNVGSFIAKADGHGGTLIVDPPMSPDNATASVLPAASPVTVNADQFVFRTGEFGQAIAKATASPVVAVNEHGQFDFSSFTANQSSNALPDVAEAHAPATGEALREAVLGAAQETTDLNHVLDISPSLPPHQPQHSIHWDLHA